MKRILSKTKGVYDNLSLPLKVSVWFFICSLFQKGLSFLTTPLFTRILSTSDYGLVTVYNSWEQIIIIFITMSLSNSVFNVGLVKFDDDRNNFQSSMLGLEIIWFACSSCIFLFAYKFLIQYIQLPINYILIMVSTCFCSTIVGMWTLRKRLDYNYRSMTTITIVNTVVGVCFSLLFVFLMEDKAYGKIFGGFVILVVLAAFCVIDFLRTSKHIVDIHYWKFALKYNIPMIPHFLSSVILNQLDRIMIQNMVGISQAGIYSVAYSSAGVVYIVNQALSASYNPWFLQRLKAKTYNGIKEIVNVILVIYMAALTMIILFAPEIMHIMAPLDYYEGIYVIPPVASSMFFILLFNLFAPVEHFSLKTKFMGIASTVSAVANIVLNYIFINLYGYLAAGYTTLACYILYALAHWIYMKKCCHQMGGVILFDNKRILFLSVMVVVISLVSALLYQLIIIRYVFIAVILVICIIKRQSILLVFKEIRK